MSNRLGLCKKGSLAAAVLLVLINQISTLEAQFTDLSIEVDAMAIEQHDRRQASSLPVKFSVGREGDFYHEIDPGVACFGNGSSHVNVVGSSNLVLASLGIFGQHSGSNRCAPPPDLASAGIEVSAVAQGTVYRTVGKEGGLWEEALVATTPVGAFSDSLFLDLPFGCCSRVASVSWAIGSPSGSPTTAFPPLSSGEVSQFFNEPTPGDATKDGGLRFQIPDALPSLATGFMLSSASNPFTRFQFPEAPAGVDPSFSLEFGGTRIVGLPGEMVNLRSYAPDGLSEFTLRGDLADLGGPNGQFTFGSAFAYAGIASFTLTPVPEPGAMTLALAALLGLGLPRLVRQPTAIANSNRRSCRVPGSPGDPLTKCH